MKKTLLAILVAAVLWFIMFSPWTAPHVDFWYTMTASGVILTSLSLMWGKKQEKFSPSLTWQVMWGIVIAVVLWGVFWTGDKLSQMLFDFARPQVNSIYEMKGGMSGTVIALLLLFIIGPAEEIFWRGFVQRRLAGKYGRIIGFIIATACYTLVHIWSFNFMLIVAAAACGCCWGLLYCIRPKMLPALIVSHALWDAAAFVIFPF
jgi:uncharacterized protein